MDKLEFIVRQLAKTDKKNYENYVVTRILNKLDNLDVKFITQQYVSRGEAKHPIENDTSIWLPKLYPNGEWDNSISFNEDIIFEKAASTNQKYYGFWRSLFTIVFINILKDIHFLIV